MASDSPPIVLYHYSYSPYARRILWYLQLRKIQFAECKQPSILPRPDLSSRLGVNYRRIPILAIGKDVYCDTRLILDKLETLYPEGSLSAKTPNHLAIQRLLSKWVTEGDVFMRSSQLIPVALLSDPRFTKDREQMTGRKWDKASVEKNRPEALVVIYRAFDFLERVLLSDGRNWVLGTDQPTLADIEAVWSLDWLNTMPGALPQDYISAKQFPRVFAWMTRFNQATKQARAGSPRVSTLSGEEAASSILKAGFAESASLAVDAQDPLGVEQGTHVEVWPIDSGFSHKDTGKLLGLSEHEITIGLENGLRVHFPRSGFRLRRIKPESRL